ncbi:MAG: translation elongation factor-like protein [Chloroflexi bacterium]|nr:translation elongation factor-like protein [Chloroflexota bacterium]MCL5074875.1 translation elongation factor-like protein [Chloroflexota bacterium]
MEEKEIGVVTHYYTHLQVAALRLTEELHLGDTIHIKGHSTDLTQTVDSMEIEHQKVEKAGPGQAVAIKVKEHVREHDQIYKVLS